MARVIETSVRIAAPPARVWSVLMDFGAYPSWNPFVRSIAGDKSVGGKLEVVLELPGGKPQTFRPVVTEIVPEQMFCWRGTLPIPGLFTGEHRFSLATEGQNTRFTQSEAFSGLLVPFVGGVLAATERGFHAMNEKLKVRSEGS
ncbi:MAG: SRPBCC domain-containing protein [Proteobacteria bacterium]|nr:SRPBCC domain-containing protein [Pseudomonadota bacterium]